MLPATGTTGTQFLLEKLASPPAGDGGLGAFNLAGAVADQIQRIVSARLDGDEEEEDSARPAFGMPSIVALGAPDRSALEAYAARLARQIARYEPRLDGMTVTVEASGQSLPPYRLLVRGSLAPDQEQQAYRFDLPAH